MYIANHYVPINGRMYMKGERIPDGLPEEKLNWLLKAEAVHEVALPSAPVEAEKETELPAEEPDTAEPETEAGPPPEEEVDEDAEAPEIDVMAGIVQDDPEEPEKPARKAKTRKQAERRKSI